MKAKITIPDLEKQTFGEYMLVWLHSIKKGIEVTTYQSYLDAVNSRLLNYRAYDLANVRLKDLNDKMFQAYLNSLAENYSLNSIKKVWGLIKTCVRYAEAVSTCSNGAYKYGNATFVVILIMYTGMRVSEAIGLQWKDVDMERREIAVNQSLAMIKDAEKGDPSYSYRIKSAKTKDSRRKILLPDKAFEAILHFRKYYQGEDGFVCVNDKNQNHYTRRLVERTLERIVKNSKCRDKSYSPHSLRHGYGSILLSMGTDIKIVSELLGHSDVSFTYNVYIDIFDRDKQDAVMKLNQI